MSWDPNQQQQAYSYNYPDATNGQSQYDYNNYSQTNNSNGTGLRRRNADQSSFNYQPNNLRPSNKKSQPLKHKIIKNMDLFPKTESGLTVQSEQGRRLSTFSTLLALILTIAEYRSWSNSNNAYNSTTEQILVDQSLNQKIKVDLNITFPSLHCDDVHLSLMDVAGDVHIDVDNTMIKRRLHLDTIGSFLSDKEIEVEMNDAHVKEQKAREALKKSLADDYCGPCYGAQEEEGQCCDLCEDVIEAYKNKHWHTDQVRLIAEQCIREHKTGPKRMSKGEGCNIAGHMSFNRVNGNFHIAMGDAVERDGQTIHSFIPDDMENFNASHVIHELRFGPVFEDVEGDSGSRQTLMGELKGLNGVEKIVQEKDGTTGAFQYFIKIVPTTYRGHNIMESILFTKEMSLLSDKDDGEIILKTNRYFSTERFTPLMAEDITEEHAELGDMVMNGLEDDDGSKDDDSLIAGAKIGGNSGTSHSHHEHHRKKQQILPGVFFIYQVYPFQIDVTKESVPITHLLIRIMATVGGVFTIAGWLDALLSSQKKKNARFG